MSNTKGLAFITVVKALRSAPEQAAETLPQDKQHYLTEIIFPSRQYPTADLLVLLDALVEILPPRPDQWEWLGTQGAESDFKGTYSALIRRGRPMQTLALFPKIWRLYHDEGVASMREVDERTAELEVRGSIFRHPGFVRLHSGHLQAICELAGARDVTVSVVRQPSPEDEADAVARWRVHWRSVDA